MGFYSWFTNKVMGKMEEGPEIKDGVIVMQESMEFSPIMVEPEEEPEQWEVPDKYIESISRTRKPRTVKEYCIDLRSFGVRVENLDREMIENRLRSLKDSTKRRKLTALKSYAKWSLMNGDTKLSVVLARMAQDK